MTQRSRPFETGLYFGTNGFSHEPLRPRQLKFSDKTRLADLADEYRFYTPAAMYSKVPLGGREPFHDFVAEYGKEACPLSMEFQHAVFEGLEIENDRRWNHVLFAIEAEHWPAFCGWMGTLAFADRDKGQLFRVRTQQLEIHDPIEIATQGVVWSGLPKVSVTAFVLDTNNGCWYFKDCGRAGTPRLVYGAQAYEDTCRFQHAISKSHGTPDPYGEIMTDQLTKDPELLTKELADRANNAKESS